MIVIAWLFLTISYNGVVHYAVYPTEGTCEEAKARQRIVWFDIRDSLCVPVAMASAQP